VRAALAVLVAFGCRGNATRHDAGPAVGPVAPVSPVGPVVSIVPPLPASPDPAEAMRTLDARIAAHVTEPDQEIELLLQRAALRGRLEDYTEALARSSAWVKAEPTNAAAWAQRASALARVHRFAAARAAIASGQPFTRDPNMWTGLVATIDEATGDLASSGAFREDQATRYPNPNTLTLWAGHLAIAGRIPEALAVMSRAAAAIRDNPASLLNWVLFQWGRIYELAGEPAKARSFFAAAHARLPTLEATAHLAQAMLASGGDPSELVRDALARDPSPELYALAGKTEDARRAWERYLAAFPEAFADHAARFYLAAGADPQRALALARLDFANRPTLEARALLVEASLAARSPDACTIVDPLITSQLRPQLFIAWRALGRCDRTIDARALARQLGIE
jgi:tetratricopeptide (TPR) repeat protein